MLLFFTPYSCAPRGYLPLHFNLDSSASYLYKFSHNDSQIHQIILAPTVLFKLFSVLAYRPPAALPLQACLIAMYTNQMSASFSFAGYFLTVSVGLHLLTLHGSLFTKRAAKMQMMVKKMAVTSFLNANTQ